MEDLTHINEAGPEPSDQELVQEETGGRDEAQAYMRRLRQDGSYKQELQRLRSRHHLIIRLMATGKVTQKQCAQIVGCTPQTVSNTINSRLGQQKMRYLQGEADAGAIDMLEEILELAPMAMAELESVLNDGTAEQKLKVQVAQDLLDRAGYGRTSNLNMRVQKVTDEDIKSIKMRARKSSLVAGSETEYNEVDEE